MPLENIQQPEIIVISETLRLRKYDEQDDIHMERMLAGYRDPVVYQNSEGIFDDAKKPDLSYIKGMCAYLNRVGELYLIEAEESGVFVPIGDVTIKLENPPIAIWRAEYRGRGIGTLVMRTVIARLRTLGFKEITGSTVYTWNVPSQKMHEKLGFRCVRQEDTELFYNLKLEDYNDRDQICRFDR